MCLPFQEKLPDDLFADFSNDQGVLGYFVVILSFLGEAGIPLKVGFLHLSFPTSLLLLVSSLRSREFHYKFNLLCLLIYFKLSLTFMRIGINCFENERCQPGQSYN